MNNLLEEFLYLIVKYKPYLIAIYQFLKKIYE